MLGYLEGKVIFKNEESFQVVVRMHRMGFEVTLPRRLFDTIVLNQKVALWLHTHVREDILALYGFENETDRMFFKHLLGVSGLGPKTALALLGEHGSSRLLHLIQNKETDEMATAPGVGKKLAQKVCLELSGKLEKWAWVTKLTLTPAKKVAKLSSPAAQLRDDLSSALVNLGYQPSQVKSALDRVSEREDLEALGFESGLKTALREMSARPLASERPHG